MIFRTSVIFRWSPIQPYFRQRDSRHFGYAWWPHIRKRFSRGVLFFRRDFRERLWSFFRWSSFRNRKRHWSPYSRDVSLSWKDSRKSSSVRHPYPARSLRSWSRRHHDDYWSSPQRRLFHLSFSALDILFLDTFFIIFSESSVIGIHPWKSFIEVFARCFLFRCNFRRSYSSDQRDRIYRRPDFLIYLMMTKSNQSLSLNFSWNHLLIDTTLAEYSHQM